MLTSDAFSYVNILDRTLDASWKRQTAIANNIANVDTPGYKRQDVTFSNILTEEIEDINYKTRDQAIRHADMDDLESEIYTDAENFSYRIDKNNVDIDSENVELASEQLKYQTMTTATSSEFSRFRTAASIS